MKKKEKFSFRFNLPDHLAKRGALVLISFFFPLFTFAGEEGGTIALPQLVDVPSKNLEITTHDQTMTMTQTTPEDVVANFHSFNIGERGRVDLHQPLSSSNAFFRITGNTGISRIDGTFTAKGNVYLLTSNGLVIGEKGIINMNNFIATTHSDFRRDLNNNIHLEGLPNPEASVVNYGRITVGETGVAAFASPITRNYGGIFGRAAFVAGEKTTLTFDGSDIVRFEVSGKLERAIIEQKGRVVATGKEVLLSTTATENFLDTHMINMDGEVKGAMITMNSGDNSQITVGPNARLDATGENGGDIRVLGDFITLKTGATLDASGDHSGGRILVGGAREGKGPERNAVELDIEDNVKMSADSRISGNAGEIINYADVNATIWGIASASALGEMGNGGFIEYSGKQHLWFAQDDVHMPQLSSRTGKAGTFFIDPDTVTIGTGGAQTITYSSSSGALTLASSGGNGKVGTTDITPAYILTQLGSNSVAIAATSSILLTSDIIGSSIAQALSLTAPTITLNAGKTITLGNGTNLARLALTTNTLSGNTTGSIQVAGGVTVNALANTALSISNMDMQSNLTLNNPFSAATSNTAISNIGGSTLTDYASPFTSTRPLIISASQHRGTLTIDGNKFMTSGPTDAGKFVWPLTTTSSVTVSPSTPGAMTIGAATGGLMIGIANSGKDVDITNSGYATTVSNQINSFYSNEISAITPCGNINFHTHTLTINAPIYQYKNGDMRIKAVNVSAINIPGTTGNGVYISARNLTIDRSLYTENTTTPGYFDIGYIIPTTESLKIKGMNISSTYTKANILIPWYSPLQSITLESLKLGWDLDLSVYHSQTLWDTTNTYNLHEIALKNVQLEKELYVTRSTTNNLTDPFILTLENLSTTPTGYLKINAHFNDDPLNIEGVPLAGTINARNLTLSNITGVAGQTLAINPGDGYSTTGVTTFTSALNFVGGGLSLGGAEVKFRSSTINTIDTGTGTTEIDTTLGKNDPPGLTTGGNMYALDILSQNINLGSRAKLQNFHLINGLGRDTLLTLGPLDAGVKGTSTLSISSAATFDILVGLTIQNTRISSPGNTAIDLLVSKPPYTTLLNNVDVNSPLSLKARHEGDWQVLSTIDLRNIICTRDLTVTSDFQGINLFLSNMGFYNNSSFNVIGSGGNMIRVNLKMGGAVTYSGAAPTVAATPSTGAFNPTPFGGTFSSSLSAIDLSNAKTVTIVPLKFVEGVTPSTQSFKFSNATAGSSFSLITPDITEHIMSGRTNLIGLEDFSISGALVLSATNLNISRTNITGQSIDITGTTLSADTLYTAAPTLKVTGDNTTSGLLFKSNSTTGLTFQSDNGAPIIIGPASGSITIGTTNTTTTTRANNWYGRTTIQNANIRTSFQTAFNAYTGDIFIGSNTTFSSDKDVNLYGSSLTGTPSTTPTTIIAAGQSINSSNFLKIKAGTLNIGAPITGDYDLWLEAPTVTLSGSGITLSAGRTAIIKAATANVSNITAKNIYITGNDETVLGTLGNGSNVTLYNSTFTTGDVASKVYMNANTLSGIVTMNAPTIQFVRVPSFYYTTGSFNASLPTGTLNFSTTAAPHISGTGNNTITIGGRLMAGLTNFTMDPGVNSNMTLLNTLKKSDGSALDFDITLKSGGLINTNITTTGNILIQSASGTIGPQGAGGVSRLQASTIAFDASGASVGGDLFVDGITDFIQTTAGIPLRLRNYNMTDKKITFRNLMLAEYYQFTAPVSMHNVTLIPTTTSTFNAIRVANGTAAGTLSLDSFGAIQKQFTSLYSGHNDSTLALNYATGTGQFDLTKIDGPHKVGSSITNKFKSITIAVDGGGTQTPTLTAPPSVVDTISVLPTAVTGTLAINNFTTLTDLSVDYPGTAIQLYGPETLWETRSFKLNQYTNRPTTFQLPSGLTLRAGYGVKLNPNGVTGRGVITTLNAGSKIESTTSIALGAMRLMDATADISFRTAAFAWDQDATDPGNIQSVTIAGPGSTPATNSIAITSTGGILKTTNFSATSSGALTVSMPIQTYTAGNTGIFLFKTTAGTGPFQVTGSLGGDGTVAAAQPDTVTFSPYQYRAGDSFPTDLHAKTSIALTYSNPSGPVPAGGTSLQLPANFVAPAITVDAKNIPFAFNDLGTLATPVTTLTASSTGNLTFSGNTYATTMNITGGAGSTMTLGGTIYTTALTINSALTRLSTINVTGTIDSTATTAAVLNLYGSAINVTGNLGGTRALQSFTANASGNLNITNADIKATTGNINLAGDKITGASTSGNNILSTTGNIIFSGGATNTSVIAHILDVKDLNLAGLTFPLTLSGSRIGKETAGDRGTFTLTGATSPITLSNGRILFNTATLSGSSDITISGGTEFTANTINITGTGSQTITLTTPIKTQTLTINPASTTHAYQTIIKLNGSISALDGGAAPTVRLYGNAITITGTSSLQSLTANASGGISVPGSLTIANGLSLTARGGALSLSGAYLKMAGNLTLSSSGTFTMNTLFTRTDNTSPFTLSNAGSIIVSKPFGYSAPMPADSTLSLTSTGGDVVFSGLTVDSFEPDLTLPGPELAFPNISLSAPNGIVTVSSNTKVDGISSFTAEGSSIAMSGTRFQVTGDSTFTSSGTSGISVTSGSAWTVAGLTMTANGSGNILFNPTSFTATGATSFTSNGSTGITADNTTATWTVAGLTMTANGSGGILMSNALTSTDSTQQVRLVSGGDITLSNTTATWLARDLYLKTAGSMELGTNIESADGEKDMYFESTGLMTISKPIGKTLGGVTAAPKLLELISGSNLKLEAATLAATTGTIELLGASTLTISSGTTFLGDYTLSTIAGDITVSERIGSDINRGALTFNPGGTLKVKGDIYASTLAVNGSMALTGATNFYATNPATIAGSNISVPYALTSTNDLTLNGETGLLSISAPLTSTAGSITLSSNGTAQIQGTIGAATTLTLGKLGATASFSLIDDTTLNASTLIRAAGIKILGKATASSSYPSLTLNTNATDFTGAGNTMSDFLGNHFGHLEIKAKTLDMNNNGAIFTVHGALSLDVDSGDIAVGGPGIRSVGNMSSSGDIIFRDPVVVDASGDVTFTIGGTATFEKGFIAKSKFTLNAVNDIILGTVGSSTTSTAEKSVTMTVGGSRAGGRSITVYGNLGISASLMGSTISDGTNALSMTAGTIDLYGDIYARTGITLDATTVRLAGPDILRSISSSEGAITTTYNAMLFDNIADHNHSLYLKSSLPINLNHFHDGTIAKAEAPKGFLLSGAVAATRTVPLSLTGKVTAQNDGGGVSPSYISTVGLSINGDIAGGVSNVTFNTGAGILTVGGTIAANQLTFIGQIYLSKDTTMTTSNGLLTLPTMNSPTTAYSLTVTAPSLSIGNMGMTNNLRTLTATALTGHITLTGGFGITGDRTLDASHGTINGLTAGHLSGGGKTTLMTSGALLLPQVGLGTPIGGLDAHGVSGALTLTGDILSQDLVHLPANTIFGANRTIESLRPTRNGGIILESNNPNATGTFTLKGQTTFTQDTTISIPDTLQLQGTVKTMNGTNGLTVTKPVTLLGHTNIETLGIFNFSNPITGNTHDLTLTSHSGVSILPTMTAIKKLTVSLSENLTVPATLTAEAQAIELRAPVGKKIIINDDLTTVDGLWLYGDVELAKAGDILFTNTTSGPIHFGGDVYWKTGFGLNPHDLTITQNALGGHITLNLERSLNPSTNITLTGASRLSGIINTPGAFTVNGPTTLIGDLLLEANTIATGTIDGAYALDVKDGTSFTPGAMGSTTPLTSFTRHLRSTTEIQNNITAGTVKLWIPDSNLRGPGKVTANTLWLIPSTGGQGFSIEAEPGEAATPFNFTVDSLLNPNLFSIGSTLKIGDPSALETIHLQGFMPLNHVKVYLYGNVITYSDSYFVTADGQVVDIIGKLTQSPEQKNLLSLIYENTEDSHQSPIEDIVNRLSLMPDQSNLVEVQSPMEIVPDVSDVRIKGTTKTSDDEDDEEDEEE